MGAWHRPPQSLDVLEDVWGRRGGLGDRGGGHGLGGDDGLGAEDVTGGVLDRKGQDIGPRDEGGNLLGLVDGVRQGVGGGGGASDEQSSEYGTTS